MRSQPLTLRRAWAALLVVSAMSGCMARRPVESGDFLAIAGDAEDHSVQWPFAPPPSLEASVEQGPSPSWFSPSQRSSGTNEFTVAHPRVNAFVTSFQTRERGSFQDALERSGKYRGRMMVILEREGLPTELAYLPLIESGYRASAVSPAGAAGLWQFIRGTGRQYGLRIDGYVDERLDPVKSTRAAARYLRDLYEMFGSWHLTLAAYNVGPERIVRTLERRGIRTYWDMVDRGWLPRETREYVARFLAALHIVRAPEQHGFAQPDCEPLRYDLVYVHRSLSFHTVAQLAGTSVAAIAELNPALVQNVTPPDGGGYRVRVPKGAKDRFELAYARMDRRASVEEAGRRASGVAQAPYQVRRNDPFAVIAER